MVNTKRSKIKSTARSKLELLKQKYKLKKYKTSLINKTNQPKSTNRIEKNKAKLRANKKTEILMKSIQEKKKRQKHQGQEINQSSKEKHLGKNKNTLKTGKNRQNEIKVEEVPPKKEKVATKKKKPEIFDTKNEVQTAEEIEGENSISDPRLTDSPPSGSKKSRWEAAPEEPQKENKRMRESQKSTEKEKKEARQDRTTKKGSPQRKETPLEKIVRAKKNRKSPYDSISDGEIQTSRRYREKEKEKEQQEKIDSVKSRGKRGEKKSPSRSRSRGKATGNKNERSESPSKEGSYYSYYDVETSYHTVSHEGQRKGSKPREKDLKQPRKPQRSVKKRDNLEKSYRNDNRKEETHHIDGKTENEKSQIKFSLTQVKKSSSALGKKQTGSSKTPNDSKKANAKKSRKSKDSLSPRHETHKSAKKASNTKNGKTKAGEESPGNNDENSRSSKKGTKRTKKEIFGKAKKQTQEKESEPKKAQTKSDLFGKIVQRSKSISLSNYSENSYYTGSYSEDEKLSKHEKNKSKSDKKLEKKFFSGESSKEERSWVRSRTRSRSWLHRKGSRVRSRGGSNTSYYESYYDASNSEKRGEERREKSENSFSESRLKESKTDGKKRQKSPSGTSSASRSPSRTPERKRKLAPSKNNSHKSRKEENGEKSQSDGKNGRLSPFERNASYEPRLTNAPPGARGIIQAELADRSMKVFALPAELTAMEVQSIMTKSIQAILSSDDPVVKCSRETGSNFWIIELRSPQDVLTVVQNLKGMKYKNRKLSFQAIGNIENTSQLEKQPNNNADYRMIMLKNMVKRSDLEDKKEFVELFRDIKQECKKYGRLNMLNIPRPGREKEELVGKVFIGYTSSFEANEASRALNGRRFGGRSVVACLLSAKQCRELGVEVKGE